MVQTDISQLSAECQDWRQILRNYREEFHSCEQALLSTCKQSLSKDQFTQVEHFQNQFDIQLKNVHDLKLRIKKHEQKLEAENSGEDIYADHEHLLNEFLSLESMLQELRDEFNAFINRISC